MPSARLSSSSALRSLSSLTATASARTSPSALRGLLVAVCAGAGGLVAYRCAVTDAEAVARGRPIVVAGPSGVGKGTRMSPPL